MTEAFERNKVNPNGGWTSTMLASIDKEIPISKPKADNVLNKFIKQDVSLDPAPSAEGVAQERMNSLLNGVTTTTLDQLRELRDKVDDLMRAVQSRNDTISAAFAQHVNYAASAIHCKEIIEQNIASITQNFQNGLDPLPKTVTVEKV